MQDSQHEKVEFRASKVLKAWLMSQARKEGFKNLSAYLRFHHEKRRLDDLAKQEQAISGRR